MCLGVATVHIDVASGASCRCMHVRSPFACCRACVDTFCTLWCTQLRAHTHAPTCPTPAPQVITVDQVVGGVLAAAGAAWPPDTATASSTSSAGHAAGGSDGSARGHHPPPPHVTFLKIDTEGYDMDVSV